MSVKPPAPTLTPDKYRLAVTVNLPMNGDPDPLVCLPEGPVIWLIRNNDGKHGFDVTIDPAKFTHNGKKEHPFPKNDKLSTHVAPGNYGFIATTIKKGFHRDHFTYVIDVLQTGTGKPVRPIAIDPDLDVIDPNTGE
jgi:hypothetical protein